MSEVSGAVTNRGIIHHMVDRAGKASRMSETAQ